VLFQEPRATAYDFSFSFLGFPVRVHPAFFIMPVILGGSVFSMAEQLEVNIGVTLLVLVVVFFISILVHELGHTFAFRMFGIPSRILLYWLGGLAIPDAGGAWSIRSKQSLTSNQQILVSLAGPFFGFCLAGVFIGLVYLLGGEIKVLTGSFMPTLVPDLRNTSLAGNGAMFIFLFMGMWVNVFWNVLNLAPVFPLDGGQATRELLNQFDPSNGIRYSLIASVVAAALIAVYALSIGDHFIAFFFGYMAYINYQSLNSFGSFGGRGPW